MAPSRAAPAYAYSGAGSFTISIGTKGAGWSDTGHGSTKESGGSTATWSYQNASQMDSDGVSHAVSGTASSARTRRTSTTTSTASSPAASG